MGSIPVGVIKFTQVARMLKCRQTRAFSMLAGCFFYLSEHIKIAQIILKNGKK